MRRTSKINPAVPSTNGPGLAESPDDALQSVTPPRRPTRRQVALLTVDRELLGRLRRLPLLAADAALLGQFLGVGERSIRKWDRAGLLPRPIKLGNRTLWVLGGRWGIRAWLQAGAPGRETWEALQHTGKTT